MVTYVTMPHVRPSNVETVTVESNARAPDSSSKKNTVWKSILRIALTIVIIAAIVIVGRIVVPKVIDFLVAVGNTTAAGAELATEAANTTTVLLKRAKHVLFEPVAYDIVHAIDAVATTVNAVSNSLFVETVSAAATAAEVIGPKTAVMTFLPWLALTMPKLPMIGGN